MNDVKNNAEIYRKRTLYNFIINNLLLFSGILMIISGLVLQHGYHRNVSGVHHAFEFEGHANQDNYNSLQYEQLRGIDTIKAIWGLRYSGWTIVHKFSIVFFSLFMLYHIYAHWKWYKGVVVKHLIGKNIQVTIISILFLIVALTGIIPWFIDLSGSTNLLRFIFIELHDKFALVLIIFLIIHLVKRMKWYLSAYKKLKA
jgi:hypothetical protein